MRNEINMRLSRALGKGVFQPSRAPIAREMECRIKLGSSLARQRRVDATSSRH